MKSLAPAGRMELLVGTPIRWETRRIDHLLRRTDGTIAFEGPGIGTGQWSNGNCRISEIPPDPIVAAGAGLVCSAAMFSAVLVEFKEGDLPEGPPESVKIPRDKLVALVIKAGLVLAAEQADLLPYQTFLVFRKP